MTLRLPRDPEARALVTGEDRSLDAEIRDGLVTFWSDYAKTCPVCSESRHSLNAFWYGVATALGLVAEMTSPNRNMMTQVALRVAEEQVSQRPTASELAADADGARAH